MASTYSSNLKIELMSTGENAGTWGNITNTNLGTAYEQAVIGLGNPDYTSDANLTITLTDSNASQAARCLVLNVTSAFGSLTATRELIVPTIQKQYIVQNNTTGGQSITVKTSAGTGITVPNGRKAHLYVNGTSVIQMFDFINVLGGTIDNATLGATTASSARVTTLNASGATTLDGTVALGNAAGDVITVPGTLGSNLLFTDNTYDIGASGATRPRNLFLAGAATVGGNLSVGGTLTITGGINLNGNVTVGDASTDTLTINSTITSNLIFTDNTYDIGASGATRPRNLFLAGNATIGGAQTLTGALTVDSTTDSTSTTTGSIQTDGGVGIAKALFVGTTATVASLTSGRVTFAGASGLLTDSANMTFDGTRLTLAGLNIVTSGSTNSIQMTGSGTASAYTLYQNTGGNFYVGRDNSVGNVFGSAYASVLYSTGAYPMIFWTNDVERSRITSAGDVLMGTTTSTYTSAGRFSLELNASNNVILAMKIADAQNFYIQSLTTATNFWNVANAPLIFGTNNAERARVESNGRFGIATNAPQGLLQVGATGSSIILDNTISDLAPPTTGNDLYIFRGSNDGSMNFSARPGGGSVYRFWRGATSSMVIDGSGNVGIGTTSPNTPLQVNGTIKSYTPSVSNSNFLLRNSTTGDALGFAIQQDGVNTYIYNNSNGVMAFATNSAERMRITSAGDVGIGSTVPGTYGRVDINQFTDPGTTPAALSVRLVGAGGGSAVPQYGINVDASQSYNNASIVYGIKVVAAQNVGGVTYGVHSTTNPGNSTTNRWAIYGKANVNADASHSLATLPVGVYGEAGNTTGTTNVSTSAAGYFLNSSTLGNTAYGVYIKTTAGPSTILPLRVDHASSELLRVSSDGVLQVGRTGGAAPDGKLQTGATGTGAGAANTKLGFVLIEDDSGNGAGLWLGSMTNQNTGVIGSRTSTGNIAFQTYDGSWGERMRLTYQGNLLLGATSFQANTPRLFVTKSSQGVSGNNIVWINDSAATATAAMHVWSFSQTTAPSSAFVDAYYNGVSTLAFRVAGNGNVTNANNSYGSTSDIKLKENIVDASPKLNKLMQVRVRNYNLKGDYEKHKQLGVIAQEIEQIFPAMVTETFDRDAEGNDLGTTTKSVKYSVFVPMLIKALQEQQAIIESLKARLDAANL
jgi:hypothetical protein